MAEHYSFFDAQGSEGNYDRTYSSADLATYFASFIGNGVYANPANQLKVSPVTGQMAVSVAVGKAWINGYFYELTDTPKQLNLSVGDSSNARIDLIVCSLNLSNRLIELKVIQGASAGNPQEPAYSRTDDVYDLVLAKVDIAAGAIELSEADITDTRPNNTYCGFVTGVVEQIDTTNLFSQYDAEFNAWFDDIKDTLDEDTAASLANQIAELQEQMEETVPITKGGTGATTAEQALTNLGAAASNHNHSAANITSGTLPISRGGTGATTASQALTSLGAASSSHTHTMSDISGTLPISKGGTGATSRLAAMNNIGITMNYAEAPSTGTPNTIYIQILD